MMDFFKTQVPKRQLFLNRPYPGAYVRAFNKIVNRGGRGYPSYVDYRAGVYFLNLSRSFKDYHLYTSPYMAFIYITLSLSTTDDFLTFYRDLKRFLDFSKESNYRVLQNYFNNELWESNTPEEAFCYVVLMNYARSRKYLFTEHGFSGEWKDNGLDAAIDYVLNTIEFLSANRENIFFYTAPTPPVGVSGAVHFFNFLEKSLKIDINCIDREKNHVIVLDTEERKELYPSFSVVPLSNGCSFYLSF